MKMKPETIERRKRERLAELAHDRELFLRTYAEAQVRYGLPGIVAPEGFHFSDFLPDGRCIIISRDRLTVF